MLPKHKLANLQVKLDKLEDVVARMYGAQIALSRIIDLLRTKGIITDAEIKSAIEEVASKSTEKRTTEHGNTPTVDASDVGHSGPEQDIHPNEGDGTVESGDAESKS